MYRNVYFFTYVYSLNFFVDKYFFRINFVMNMFFIWSIRKTDIVYYMNSNITRTKFCGFVVSQLLSDFYAVVGLSLRVAYKMMRHAAGLIFTRGSTFITSSIVVFNEGETCYSVCSAFKSAFLIFTKTAILDIKIFSQWQGLDERTHY